MKSLIRTIFVTLLMMTATVGLFLSEDAEAGTPVTGDIVVDTVWSPAGSPYWMETDVTVLAGVELSVQAGTEIRVNGYYGLTVEGRLLVEGNAINPVIFTYNGTTPSPSDWMGILVSGEAHINYANISYGYWGVSIGSSYNTVNDSFFYRNEDAIGLLAGVDNVIRDNTLYNSTYNGIVVWESTSNELIGNNATRNGDTGIWLYHTSGTLVQQNVLYRNYWNGIRISGTSWSNVVVENTVLESQLYQGIGIWDSHDNFILNNTIRRNNYNGVYLGDYSSGNNVSLNDISDSVNYHGISLGYSDGNIILNNTIQNCSNNGIYIANSMLNRVWRNEISDSLNYHGVSMSSASWNDIALNKITNVFLDGVYMEDSWSNTIANNTISGAWHGISMYDCWTNEIFDNNVSLSSQGIYSSRSTGVDVFFNNLSGNGMGVTLDDDSNGVNIVGNVFHSNVESGMQVGFSDQIVVSGNEFVQNSICGIALGGASNVTIRENNFTSNGNYGIFLASSSSISVYHNNFVGNVKQAFDDAASENAWDDGYPSGGNYWSDYTGIDAHSGPAQDQPGSDAIGDTPYVIDSDSQDNYPLVHPFGTDYSLPPTNLDARLSGMDLENVTLTWNLSADDGSGKDDVIGYEIHRGVSYDPHGNGYVLIDQVLNGTSTYTDAFVGEGDPNDYFYRVCVVNSKNVSSCGAYQAAKFTCPLSPGPNLVSIPLIQSSESIETVLQTVQYDKAWFYDPSTGEWKWFMKHKGYRRGLFNINHTMGLWINVTQDSNLTVAGVVPAQTRMHLYEGWNLISFPSFNSSYTVNDLKMNTGAMRVEGYDSAPPYHLRVLSDVDVLQAGYGYWVRVPSSIDWVIEVS